MKKKIWILNHYATEMFINKGGRHYWFAEQLQLRNYDPTIFCSNTFYSKGGSILINKGKFIVDNSLSFPFVFVKTKKSKGNGLDRVINMIGFYYNIMRSYKAYYKKNGKPDVILASSVHPLTLVAGIKIAKKLNIPCICEVRDLWPEAIFEFKHSKETSIIGRILLTGERWIYTKANALIFTKEGDHEYLIEKKMTLQQGGGVDLKKVHYINNGIDYKAFKSNIFRYSFFDKDLESGKFIVTYVGAIRPINDLDKIIDTAKNLLQNRDILFLVYGDGSERKRIEERVKEERVVNVVIKGFVEKNKIPYILSKSSVNVLNYSQKKYNWKRGNSSNKLFEYMASGKPIISTVKMGYSIIEKYKCGIEIEDASPAEISKAILDIKELSEQDYLEFGQNSLNGSKDFDFSILTNKLIEIIDAL